MKSKNRNYEQRIISPKASLKTIFFKDSGGFSSKRICGVFGWLVCLVIFILAFFMQRDIPEFSDMLVMVSASLLGLDSITSIFNKQVNR